MGVESGEGKGASAQARAQAHMRELVHLPVTAEPRSVVLEQVGAVERPER